MAPSQSPSDAASPKDIREPSPDYHMDYEWQPEWTLEQDLLPGIMEAPLLPHFAEGWEAAYQQANPNMHAPVTPSRNGHANPPNGLPVTHREQELAPEEDMMGEHMENGGSQPPAILPGSTSATPFTPSPSPPPAKLTTKDESSSPAALETSRVLQDVGRINRPVMGPPPSHAGPSRIQPTRAAKRKRDEQENTPSPILVEGRGRYKRRVKEERASPSPSGASVSDSEPVRKRRKQDELEPLVVKPNTRCGLEGCNKVLSSDLSKARDHVWTHYKDVIPTSGKARSPKAGNTKGKKADSGGKVQYPCKYITTTGQRCLDSEGEPTTFSGSQGLQRHLEGTHYGWKYRCEACQRTFSRRDALCRHRLARHQNTSDGTMRPPSGSGSGSGTQSDSESESKPEPESDSDSGSGNDSD